MKTFRIKHERKGFIDLYNPQIKTFWGWREFRYYDNEFSMWFKWGTPYKKHAEECIEYYRKFTVIMN